MGVVIAMGLILSGMSFDLYDFIYNMPFTQWEYWYSFVRDLQFIGFGLLSFSVCPYKRVELKVLTFFVILWRIFVAGINAAGIEAIYSPLFVVSATAFYLCWMARAGAMGKFKSEDPIDGAYIFYMPIHSSWGLLKAVFMPWEGARYESIVLVQGCMLWAVHDGRFITKRIEDTNLTERPGVRKYLGRNLTFQELNRLAHLVGKRAIPGIRDCRKLRRFI